MILVAYGDQWSAAANIKRKFTWAAEDRWYITQGTRAHPDNIPYSFSYRLARQLHAGYHAGMSKDATLDSIIQDTSSIIQNNEIALIVTWDPLSMLSTDTLSQFSQELTDRGIPHCFMNTETRASAKGQWVWDPSKMDLATWAREKKYLTDEGNGISIQGHIELANLLFRRLTDQLDNCKVVK